MADHPLDIVILEQRIDHETLRRLVQDGFGDMVKFVADVRRGMEIGDPVLRERVRNLTNTLVGEGEEH